MPIKPDPIAEEREAAWVGDAVLALFAREWILRERGRLDAAAMTRMTSNGFLNALGNPTAVEAEIGRLYRRDGLDAAFAYLEKTVIPLFQKQEKNRTGGRKGR